MERENQIVGAEASSGARKYSNASKIAAALVIIGWALVGTTFTFLFGSASNPIAEAACVAGVVMITLGSVLALISAIQALFNPDRSAAFPTVIFLIGTGFWVLVLLFGLLLMEVVLVIMGGK